MLFVSKMAQKNVRPVEYLCFSERGSVCSFILFYFFWRVTEKCLEPEVKQVEKKREGESIRNGIKNPPVHGLVSVVNMHSRNTYRILFLKRHSFLHKGDLMSQLRTMHCQ